VRKLPLLAIVAVAFSLGACASSSDDAGAGSKADSGKAWWRLSKYSRQADFKAWHYGDVRPGKGALGGDEDGITIYKGGSTGSSDPDKPSKVRR
jgi:hypothetical protein